MGVTYFDLAADDIADLRESESGGMAYGSEFETSMMLYLYPVYVREERPSEYGSESYERGTVDLVDSGPVAVYRSFDKYSESSAVPNLNTLVLHV